MLGSPRHNYNIILIILTYILLEDGYLCNANNLRSGISYRIRNGLDGSVLTAHYPTFASDLTLKLGEVTTEEWRTLSTQLWNVYFISNQTSKLSSSDIIWIKPRAAILNVLTGIPKKKEVELEVREITRYSETYIVRNPKTNLCLQSRGEGMQIFFENCVELRVAQQWDFDDPNGQKFQHKIAK